MIALRDDLRQEAALAAWQARGKATTCGLANPDAYARTAARRAVASAMRRAQRRVLDELATPPAAANVDPGTVLDLGRALARLTPRQVQALRLWVEGQSAAEIGQLLDVSRSTAHAEVASGLAKAREALS